MRRVLRVLKVVALVLVLLIALGAALFYWRARRAFPQVEGRVQAPGLHAPVEVHRDAWGVPHIYAQDLHDLLFGLGYVSAQDRLWQLEIQRRMGHGRLSEAFGEGLVRFDRGSRTLGMARAARAEWDQMDPEARGWLQAYVDGLNASLAQRQAAGRLPVEYMLAGLEPTPWTPVDCLASLKVLYWALSENGGFEMSRARFIAKAGERVTRRLLPPYAEGAPVIVPPGVQQFAFLSAAPPLPGVPLLWPLEPLPGPHRGSNSFVVHGTRSASGRPLLANDTHLDLFLPSMWYTVGLHGAGIDVAGDTLVGVPGVIVGHNARIAWGVTDLVPDAQDVYVETVDDPKDPKRYKFRGEWRELETLSETLEVRDAPAQTLVIRRTHHGPLINQTLRGYEDQRALAMAWTGAQGATALRAAIELNRAHDWDSFRAALALWDGPQMNFVYADVDGHIGYQAAGRIPVRAPGHGGEVPVPGDTGEFEWAGFIPFEELPRAFDPAQGFLVAANQKVAGPEYPHHLGYEFADPFRAARLGTLLAQDQRLTPDAAQRLQGDTYHLPAEALRPHLLRAQASGPVEERALGVLGNWDLRCTPDQAGPAVYQAVYRALVEETVGDELGDELRAEYLGYYWVHGPTLVGLAAASDDELFDDVRTPQRESRDDIVTRALRRGVAWLAARQGDDPSRWNWGALHTMTIRHRPFGLIGNPLLDRIFNYGPFTSAPCDRFTVNAAWFADGSADEPFAAFAGPAQRVVMDLADWDGVATSNSSGQNEAIFHPHRTDLAAAWREQRYHPLPFSREAVRRATQSSLTLEPSAGR